MVGRRRQPHGRGIPHALGTPPYVPADLEFTPPPPPNPAWMEDMQQMFQSMSQMFAQNAVFQQALLQLIPQAAVPPLVQQTKSYANYWVLQDKFKKEVGLQKFEGTSDPLEAEKWLDLVKEVLMDLEVLEAFRLRMVTHQLVGDAQHWWRSFVTARPGVELTWDDFQRAFTDLYFPESVRSNLRMRFEELKQKNKTMRKYQTEFDSLSRYGVYIIPDDLSRERPFEHELPDSTRVVVEPQRLLTYTGVLECALIVEENEKRVKPYIGSSSSDYSNRVDRQKRLEIRGCPYDRPSTQKVQIQNHRLSCIHCGLNNHLSNHCSRLAITCYRCGQPGHLIKDCLYMLPATVVQDPQLQQQALCDKDDTDDTENSNAIKTIDQSRDVA